MHYSKTPLIWQDVHLDSQSNMDSKGDLKHLQFLLFAGIVVIFEEEGVD